MAMDNINWKEFYNKKTVSERRKYLRSVLTQNEHPWQKRLVSYLLVINKPVKYDDNDTKMDKARKFGQQTVNFGKSSLRHIILPFPIVWTHKNSVRLQKKSVYSMEQLLMSEKRMKDFISASRTGAPQYRGILIGAATLFLGLAIGAGLSAPPLGLAALSVMTGYAFYAAYRASRKSKLQNQFLKSKMGSEIRKDKEESMYVRMFGLVDSLEITSRRFGKEDGVEVVKEKIQSVLRAELSHEAKFDFGQTEQIAEITRSLVVEFRSDLTKIDNEEDLELRLNQFILDLENVDIPVEFNRVEFKQKTEKTLRALIGGKEIEKETAEVFQELVEVAKSNGWTLHELKDAINETTLEQKDKNMIIQELGGDTIINFDDITAGRTNESEGLEGLVKEVPEMQLLTEIELDQVVRGVEGLRETEEEEAVDKDMVGRFGIAQNIDRLPTSSENRETTDSQLGAARKSSSKMSI